MMDEQASGERKDGGQQEDLSNPSGEGEPPRKRMKFTETKETGRARQQGKRRWHSHLLHFMLQNKATKALLNSLEWEDLVSLWDSVHPWQRIAVTRFMLARCELVMSKFSPEPLYPTNPGMFPCSRDETIFNDVAKHGRLRTLRVAKCDTLPNHANWEKVLRANAATLESLSLHFTGLSNMNTAVYNRLTSLRIAQSLTTLEVYDDSIPLEVLPYF